MRCGLLFSANRRAAVFTAIRVHTRANEKSDEASDESKNISCSVIFLCIPLHSVCVENDIERGLTERKRMLKMQ